MTKKYNDYIMGPEEYRKKKAKQISEVALRRRKKGKKFNHKGVKME